MAWPVQPCLPALIPAPGTDRPDTPFDLHRCRTEILVLPWPAHGPGAGRVFPSQAVAAADHLAFRELNGWRSDDRDRYPGDLAYAGRLRPAQARARRADRQSAGYRRGDQRPPRGGGPAG